uniref:Uncharacterized protein n=1 Tax=Anguilla anguilla TaxID=7936 RepID=A0A0E9TCH7_ANGAN
MAVETRIKSHSNLQFFFSNIFFKDKKNTVVSVNSLHH